METVEQVQERIALSTVVLEGLGWTKRDSRRVSSRPDGPFPEQPHRFAHDGRKMPPGSFRESTVLWSLAPYTFLPPQDHRTLTA